MLACIEGNRRVVECILEREDVEINTIGKDGVTALGLACLQGDLAIVEMLLARQEIDINTCTEDGVSPFTVSVLKSHEQISRLFLNRPDLVLAPDSEVFLERGVDPLHVAAAKGQVDIVRRLIRFGFVIIFLNIIVAVAIAIVITRFGCDVDMRRGPSFSAIPVALMKCQSEEALVRMIMILMLTMIIIVISIITAAGEHSQPSAWCGLQTGPGLCQTCSTSMASGATSPSPSSLFIVLIVMTGARASSAGVLVPNILARPLQESHVMEMLLMMTVTMTL